MRAASSQSTCAMLGAGLLAAAGLFACITSYDELPLCGAFDWGAAATRDCADSDEVQAYQARLAHEVLRRSQWEYPAGVPLHVGIDARGRVGPVCVGSPTREAGWSTRDRVAASLRFLRAAPAAPACLTGTTVDLSSVLMERSTSASAELPLGARSCRGLRDAACTSRFEHVCGVYRDGRRRSFTNACIACSDDGVVGYFELPC